MLVSEFKFDLPDELIARYPTEERTASRLLHLDGNSGHRVDGQFRDLLDWVNPGDLMVFNNTRVIPARLFGAKATGGKVEVLVERVLDSHRVLAHVRSSKSPKPGAVINFDDNISAVMVARHESLFELDFDGDEPVLSILDRIGHMPLPPYIDRPDEQGDRERYQTVYNQRPGAVAAPTAGLHFDDAMLAALKAKGVEIAYVTLHVGAGTFQPVRADSVEEHKMHSEFAEVDSAVVDAVKRTRVRGGRVIAVGTTSVRSLESAARASRARGDDLAPYADETDIFLYPGQEFLLVDAMITNFHLPESTLIMLVAAFAGQDNVMSAYRHAVANQYRFFSYGDAMFITRCDNDVA